MIWFVLAALATAIAGAKKVNNSDFSAVAVAGILVAVVLNILLAFSSSSQFVERNEFEVESKVTKTDSSYELVAGGSEFKIDLSDTEVQDGPGTLTVIDYRPNGLITLLSKPNRYVIEIDPSKVED